MRRIFVRLGLIPSVMLVTGAIWLISIMVTLLVVSWLGWSGERTNILAALVMATLAPLIISPPVSWMMISLLLKIDRLEVEMRQAATFDALTGLLSRRAFIEQANFFLQIANRDQLAAAVLLVDIDHFKSINDGFGHACGDHVLATFGRIVHSFVRKSDLAGRLGGDEFAFLLHNSSVSQAYEFAERLLAEIRSTVIEQDGCSVRFTLSIGIASLPKGQAASVEKLLGMADKAMYIAKKNGRNRAAVFGG